MDVDSPLLVVINGHCGAGKSSVARALADHFVALGVRGVAIDFDHVVRMESSVAGFPSAHEVWVRARRVVAGLVDAFFGQGVEVVVVEGDFWARYGDYDARRDFLAHLKPGRQIAVVALHVSFEEALRRVQGDSARKVSSRSRDEEFLRRNHDGFEALALLFPSTDIRVDTDGRDTAEIVAEVVERLEGFRLGDAG